ncbi:hypothetical protein GH714_012866 [Hevea brasiliensis]|uniref:NADH dehydrogenase [ubiquinone] 1 alpha subcomplex assembly factor 3 n=1 Tax=Hevea brasiliensis TaxID=3981 RepID=A0A6A6NGV3_HEVBR|nr:hypothetical protein GH714_012866 [Hevea brasiliensis]
MAIIRQRVVAALPKLIQSLRKPAIERRSALPSLRRAFSLYDQINLIDNAPQDQLRFQGYTDTGFTVNGVEYEGSLLCVGNLLLSWSPNQISQITPESLSIFRILRPIPGESCVVLGWPWAELGRELHQSWPTVVELGSDQNSHGA